MTAQHRNPAFPGPDGRAVVVDLTPFQMPGRTEELWCHEVEPGQLVVSCLPFFTRGIAFGDLVSAEAPDYVFKAVIRRSGLRSLRACFPDRAVAQAHHDTVHAALSRLPHPHEWHGAGYFAVLMPTPEAEAEIRQALAPFLEDGRLVWEIDPEPAA